MQRRFLGSSDVPAVLGLSGWRGAFAVWARLTSAVAPQDERDDPMKQLGHIVEPGLLAWYARTRRVRVFRGPPVTAPPIYLPGGRWLGVHHDGYSPDEASVVEAKVIPLFDDEWGEDGSDGIRADYFAQVQIQVAVLARAGWVVRQGALVAVSRLSGEIRQFRLDRDEEEEEELLATLWTWWTRHVVLGEHPGWDDSTEARAYAGSRHNPEERTRRATPAEAALVSRYVALGRQLTSLGAERKTLGSDLLSRMDSRSLTLPSGGRLLRTSNGQLRTYGMGD